MHTRTRLRSRAAKATALALALLAFGFGAAACGDDSDNDSSSKDTTAASSDAETDTTGDDSMEAATADIVDTAVDAGSFTTLVKAVQAAGLEETLRGDGPFTVFAPTDEAFAKLPKGTLENLLKPENKQQLVDILTYHVVPGAAVMSDELTDGQKVKTVEGGSLTVTVGDGVKVNGATVVTPDVQASNGVIHVIDTVLMPPASSSTRT